MSVQVTFAGATYSVPEEEDLGWEDLTDYLVALSEAQTGTTDTKAWRIDATANVVLSATDDYAVAVNYAGASEVILPTASEGQIFVIADASGAALSNNITITAASGALINERASYVIRSNYGAVALQFGTSSWYVLNSRETTVEQNTTNVSVVDAAVAVNNTGVSVTNGQSCTITFAGKAFEAVVEVGDNAFKVCGELNSSTVDCPWDPTSLFLPSDAGTGVAVYKTSEVITVKNRTGVSKTIKVRFLVGNVVSATAWS